MTPPRTALAATSATLSAEALALFDAPLGVNVPILTPPAAHPHPAGGDAPAGAACGLDSRGEDAKPAGDVKPMRNRKAIRSTVPDISENQFLAQIRELAALTGWELYHTHDSRRSEAGWPDLVLASTRQRRTLFVELKKRTGKVSAAQEKWLGLLAACGHETAVWRPADMDEIKKILQGQRIGGVA